MNDLLEAIDIEVRIAATNAVREHMQTAVKQDHQQQQVEPCVIEALTDALIDLRTQQIERIWPPTR